MATDQKSTRYRRRACSGARFSALLVLSLLSSIVAADNGAGAWRLEPGFDIQTASYLQYRGGASTTYASVGAELGVKLSSPERPFAAGLFADYQLTTLAENNHAQLFGSWARYRKGRWKLSASGVHVNPGHASSLWMYASKLQFELQPGHKLAIAAVGQIGRGGGPAFQLIYNSSLIGRASLSINLGLGPNRLGDFGASTKLVWHLY